MPSHIKWSFIAQTSPRQLLNLLRFINSSGYCLYELSTQSKRYIIYCISQFKPLWVRTPCKYLRWSYSRVWLYLAPAGIQCGPADARQCWHSHSLPMWCEGQLWNPGCHCRHPKVQLQCFLWERGQIGSAPCQDSRYSRFKVHTALLYSGFI